MAIRSAIFAGLLLGSAGLRADSLSRAEELMAQGDWDRGLTQAQRAADASGSARAWSLLGEARESLGDLKGAAAAFEKAGEKGLPQMAARAKALNQALASATEGASKAAVQQKSLAEKEKAGRLEEERLAAEAKQKVLETEAAPKLEAEAEAKAKAEEAAALAAKETEAKRLAEEELAKKAAEEALAKKEAEKPQGLEKERAELEAEKARLAEEKKKLEEEKAQLEQEKKASQADAGTAREAGPGQQAQGPRGGISLLTGYWRPHIQEVLVEKAGNCGSCLFPPIYSGPGEVQEFSFPVQFGLGFRYNDFSLENVFSIAEGSLYYPASGGGNYYEVQGTLVSFWMASLGYDWKILGSREGFSLYLPLRLEGGATWITVQEQLFFGPNAGLAAGLGFKWRLSRSLRLDFSGRYHLAFEVSGLNADNGNRYLALKEEVLTDSGGPALHLGLDWMIW